MLRFLARADAAGDLGARGAEDPVRVLADPTLLEGLINKPDRQRASATAPDRRHAAQRDAGDRRRARRGDVVGYRQRRWSARGAWRTQLMQR